MSERFNSQFKQMAGRIFAILFTTILITACGNIPETKIVTISGTVRDTAGMPVENIIVEVDVLGVKEILSGTLREEYDSGIKIFYAVSDENGEYKLEWTGRYAANPSGEVIDVHFHVEAYKENDLDEDTPDILYFKPVYYSQLQKTLGDGVYYFSKTIDITVEDEEELTIPDGVTSIGEREYYANHNLVSVIIPEGVTSIGNSAFEECTELTSVTIPSSVTSIGDWAFHYCEKLAKVFFEGTLEQWIQISFGNYKSNPLFYAVHLYIDGKEVQDVVIPDGITSIGNYAFSGYRGLTSVTIPSSVTSIGEDAFYNCVGLTSVIIPNGVTKIKKYTFCSCDGLTNIIIPESVTSIGINAFSFCRELTNITIPDSVTSIEDMAFHYCTGLTSITIPEGVTSIGNSAFEKCNSLKTVNYRGSAEQWAAISIGSNNSDLTGATINYNYTGE